MKITFYKVLSYWKEGEEADFDKEARYDSNIFELFKDKLETKEQIIKSGGLDLFIYRKSSGIEDFKERPIDLVAGLYANNQFKDSKKIYKLIQEQVDVFDEKLEYVVEVDDNLLVSMSKVANKDIIEKNKLIIGIVVILFILSLGMYWYMQPSSGNEPKKKISLSKEYNAPVAKLADINKSVPKQTAMESENKSIVTKETPRKQSKSNMLEWRFDGFCKMYKVKRPGFCYEIYIEEKCKKKHDFKISYKEYAKQHTQIRGCRYGDEDENLKEAMSGDSSIPKQFFKGVKR